MPRCFMSRFFDVTMGACTHQAVFPPGAVPPTAFVPSVEMIATHMWTAGYATGANKLTTRELTEGFPYALDKHDVGPLIPDVTPPYMPNPWYAVMWPFSSRKTAFASTQEKAGGKPTACMQAVPIPFPFVTCGEPVSMPNVGSLSNFVCGKTVDISWADIGMGVLGIARSVGIDLLFFGLSQKFKPAMSQADEIVDACTEPGVRVAKGIIGKFIPVGSGSEVLQSLGKTAVSGLANFGLSAIDAARGEGNPTLEFKTGGGLLGEASAGVEWGDQGAQNKSDVKPFGQSLLGGEESGGAGGGA